MAKHKFQKALARLLREIVQLFKTLTGQFVRWFLRNILVTKRWQKGQAGFVLPTVVFMLMVVSLVVAAILFRTFTRTEQLIRENQQQIIANAATPAIDRAKSKLEYLFSDPTLPRDIPTEKSLEQLLLQDRYTFPDEKPYENKVSDISITGREVDVDGPTAWIFKTDTNGDGNTNGPQDLTTVYAILARAERGNVSVDPASGKYKKSAEDRANAFIVRNGPLLSISGSGGDSECPIQVGGNPVGWFNTSEGTAKVAKNFQVYAVTVPNALIQGNPTTNSAIATIEYQQDRFFNRANKWGAWFRTDMEIAPGPVFNWNGAMHSQGNIVVRSLEGFRSFLISAEASCLSNLENSKITLRRGQSLDPTKNPSNGGGQFLTGQIRLNNNNTFDPGIVSVDTNFNNPITIINGTPANATQSKNSIVNPANQMQMASDPLALHTRGISQPRINPGTGSWNSDETQFWNTNGGSPLRGGNIPRVSQETSCAPYVDDTYRADNRYGPKPSYNKEESNGGRCSANPELSDYGSGIPNSADDTIQSLRRNEPQAGDEQGETVGLDGYWERRARYNGLRVIVGQRLELGNPFGWNVDMNDDDADGSIINDTTPAAATPNVIPADRAFYPPNAPHSAPVLSITRNRRNEGRQYTTLRDNLAAVQATAVYHHTFPTTAIDKGYFPIAFVATTAHPGTDKTLQDSKTFRRPQTVGSNNLFQTRSNPNNLFNNTQFGNDNNEILSNFLIGEGTNGWEFNVVHGNDQTLAAFKTELGTFSNSTAPSTSLGKALKNLAYFAGDPEGYFPPKQEQTSRWVHPYPKLTMWGNFSNLRETIRLMEETGTSYDNLSIADKSNLHTAAGTLGMLAYNISYLQEFDYGNATNQRRLHDPASGVWDLEERLQQLSDDPTTGATSASRGNGEVVVNTTTNYIEIYRSGSSATDLPTVRVPIPAVAAGTSQPPVPAEAFLSAMEAIYEQTPTGTNKDRALADLQLAKLLHLKEQVERDRRFGFRNAPITGDAVNLTPAPATPNNYKYQIRHQTADFRYAGVIYDNDTATADRISELTLGCDFSSATGNNFFGFDNPNTQATDPEREAAEQRFIRLATSLCPTQPKFPSLYYLFPKYNHNHQGNATIVSQVPPGVPPAPATKPADYYYLQPGNSVLTTAPAPAPEPSPPPAEPYIADTDDVNANANTTELDPYITDASVNQNYRYTVLGDANNNGIEDGTENGIASIALLPRTRADATCTGNNWCLPMEQNNANRANLINDKTSDTNGENNTGVAFLDKGIFDGREMMNVRLLDVDLDLLRRANRDTDSWLPKSGLVYAFREDAVREDAIARPRLTTWGTYQTNWTNNDATPGDPDNTFRMNVWNNPPQDPPLCRLVSTGVDASGNSTFDCTDPTANWGRGISPKPVDYYPDPDRRTHGFRLRNGVNLTRSRWGLDSEDNIRGLSFISDNPVYIQGDFNPHLPKNSTLNPNNPGNILEEFDNKLVSLGNKPSAADYARRFYERTELNTDTFARPAEDTWRPVEIIADAVGILSSNFCDGTIEGGMRGNNNGCPTTPNDLNSSYRNSHLSANPVLSLPFIAGTDLPGYICENPFDIRFATARVNANNVLPAGADRNGCDGPIKVFRNGEMRYISSAIPPAIVTYNNYLDFGDNRPFSRAAGPNVVSAVLVSGLVPSRLQQSNGGLVNFPRFLESWDSRQDAPNSDRSQSLWLSGSMIQLNFSNYATGQWDQDSWEPTDAVNQNNQRIEYYNAPLRNWGYDVGLQYAPAGPVARRMVIPAPERSELYREPAADDPYICKLREAIDYPCEN